METGQRTSSPRTLGYVVMLVVGLAIGVAGPALAETGANSITTACSEAVTAPATGSEWAVPPSRVLPGTPY